MYTAAAAGSWDILLITQEGSTNVFLAGPTSRATPITYAAGSEFFAIRLHLGIYLPQIPTYQMRDRTIPLPQVNKTTFWLGDSSWQIPTYENAETFVAQLVRHDVLRCDDVVVDAFAREPMPPCRSGRSSVISYKRPG